MNKPWISYPRRIFRKELALGLIKKYIPEHSKFLEIGCGGGDFGITLSKIGFYGKIIDFSESAAQIIKENFRKNNIKNLQFEKKDIFDLQDKKEFDFIVFFEVLEHLKEDRRALNKINSLLRSNGFLLISVPAKKKLWGEVDVLMGHFRRYNKDELKNILNETGFGVLVLYSYGYPFLNTIKIFRDYLIQRALKQNNRKSKTEASKVSGLNTVKLPSVFKYIFNTYTLFPFIQFSKLFNRFDLTEGYLCLAKKYEKK